jgi:hypothetical protein
MISISRPKDFCAGLFFMAFGLVALWVAGGYPLGTAFNMGAGYFPTLVGGLLVIIGFVIAAGGLFGEREAGPRLKWKPLLLISLSIVLFGLLIKVIGLILTSVIMVLVSRLGGMSFQWLESLVLGVLLAAFCAMLFVYGLGLLLPLWPRLGG